MSRIRADRYTNRAGTGAPTFADGVNVVGITSVKAGAGVTTMEVTGDLSVISGTIKGESQLTISSITSSISDTAVDVFVYDTSKDSDGGAWRKRTQNTSWYNETLNTATRGSRKEFPAVAVLVLESLKLTIYDGDDPDLPMWMEFINTSGNLIGGSAMTAVTALNGIIVTGSGGYTMETRFISDYSLDWFTNQLFEYKGNIEQRNDTLGFRLIESYGIVNSATNDVAMTVSPNAPIDSATGLPVPTIAVATQGGVSVITDSGTVFDLTYTSGSVASELVEFDGTGGIFWGGYSPFGNGQSIYLYWNKTLPSADDSSAPDARYASNANTVFDLITKSGNFGYNSLSISDIIAAGASNGLFLIDQKEDSPANGMTLQMTSSYTTGWMHGDCKGAFLSDTDTTNITGSEKIANYNFAADFSTQWEVKNSANTSYDATNDRVTVTSTQNYSGIRLKSTSLPTLTNGKRYIMTVNIHSITNPIRFGVVSGGNKDSVNSTGAHTLMFTAGASISEVYIEKPSGSNSTFVLNSVSIREAEEDRSVNNNGLQVFGTITKSAVATGADLVGYSGYTNSNYIKQPYTSDMDFGTGNFSVTWWQYITGDISDSEYVYDRQGSNGHRHAIYYTSGNNGSISFYTKDSATSEMYAQNINQYKDQWACYTAIRDVSSGNLTIYINGKLGYRAAGMVARNLSNSSAELFIGIRHSVNTGAATQAKYALMRFSSSIPSAEQIKKMYEDEKVLFQENSQATLYGSSNAPTALAYDDTTELLHVGTSAGRSEFQGLRRINNTTTAVTTAISASNELVAEQ
jgi:hypothetical protein